MLRYAHVVPGETATAVDKLPNAQSCAPEQGHATKALGAGETAAPQAIRRDLTRNIPAQEQSWNSGYIEPHIPDR